LFGRGAYLQSAEDVATHDDQAAPAGRQLAFRLLGEFAVELDGRELLLTTRKAKALLAYLALSDNAQDTRERLVGLLWSESDEDRARASLRQAVHEIRSTCEAAGFHGFRVDKQALALERGCFRCDVHDILDAAARGTVHSRLLETQRISDTLLESLGSIDPALHSWALAKRQLLHDRLTLALEGLLGSETGSIQTNAAALALLNLDPTHEVACRHLIRTRAARGDVGGALKAYKTLWDLLDEEYEVEPSQETQDLIVGIKQQSGQGSAPTTQPILSARPDDPLGPAVAPKRLFISVCAFDTGGLPESRRYVVSGFRHELIACLALP